MKTNRYIFDYVFTDSKNEREFVALLDGGTDIEVYAKLPKAFSIPTPVDGYTPDWAIAFKHGCVKHVYVVAETMVSMSSMEFRKIEDARIECAEVLQPDHLGAGEVRCGEHLRQADGACTAVGHAG